MRLIRVLPCLLACACGGAATEDAGPADLGALDARGAEDAARDAGAVDGGACGGAAADSDNDGRRSIACGGDDCDDGDANRFPGNTEVCDGAGHDEDCDARTFGARDTDGDGTVDALCCNTDAGGAMHCGDDCNDMNGGVHPGVPEVCNGVDDDCNGTTDEGITHLYYRDVDGDGYYTTTSISACSPPPGYGIPIPSRDPSTHPDQIDCDDTNAQTFPAAGEIPADGIDESCDGMERCYRDVDGDGHGDEGPSGLVETTDVACTDPGHTTTHDDCCDTDTRAVPGQTSYFDTPFAGGCYPGTALLFDFDCNGTQEREYPAFASCDGSCMLVSAGWWVSGVPACGDSNSWDDACAMSLMCVPTGSGTRVQPCR